MILVACSFVICRVNDHDLVNGVIYLVVGICGGYMGIVLSR